MVQQSVSNEFRAVEFDSIANIDMLIYIRMTIVVIWKE